MGRHTNPVSSLEKYVFCGVHCACYTHRAHRVATATFWHNSITMENSALAGEGGGCTPTPFHYIYHHVQSCGVYAPAERADTLPLFLLYFFMYSVITHTKNVHKHLFTDETYRFSPDNIHRCLNVLSMRTEGVSKVFLGILKWTPSREES